MLSLQEADALCVPLPVMVCLFQLPSCFPVGDALDVEQIA
jgi:hypothetical protein